MKRLTAVLLILLMLCHAAFALQDDYTLSEKIALQMGDGSGLKGSFTLSAEGDADWAKGIAAVAGQDFQIRCIKSGAGYLLEIYAADGEDKQALTTVYFTDEGASLTSVLLPDMELKIPLGGDMLDMIAGVSGDENPTWYGAALNLTGLDENVWNTQWQDALQPYYTDVEVWMTSYGAAPVVTEENGQTVMRLRYEIPGKAAADMILTLIQRVLNDQTMTALLSEQMTPEQQALYLSPDMMFHYENVIRSMTLEGSILLERKMTTMGEVLYSSVTLPVATGNHGVQSIRMEEELGAFTFTLETDEAETILAVSAPQMLDAGEKRIVSCRYMPVSLGEESKAVSWRATVISSYETRTDDDTRGHEITALDVTLEEDLTHLAEDAPERAFYEKVEAKTLKFKLHMHSKNANTSPTTAEMEFTYASGGSSIAFAGQIKTTSPWTAGVYEAGNGTAVAEMTAEELAAVLNAYAVNAVEMLDGK